MTANSVTTRSIGRADVNGSVHAVGDHGNRFFDCDRLHFLTPEPKASHERREIVSR